jgi:hypothetical protein
MSTEYSADPASWPAWMQAGTRVWWGYRRWTIDERRADSIVIRMDRRGGHLRYALNADEIAMALQRDLLREWVKPVRRERV